MTIKADPLTKRITEHDGMAKVMSSKPLSWAQTSCSIIYYFLGLFVFIDLSNPFMYPFMNCMQF